MKEKRPNTSLRRERELRGWSQRTVAERIGTDEPGVCRWEKGYHKPSRYFQTKLCELFEKSAEELGFMDVPMAKEDETYSLVASIPSIHQYVNSSLNISPAIEQKTTAEVDLFTLGIMALVIHQQQRQWNVNELQQRVTQALDGKDSDMQHSQHISRRSVLSIIAGMPIALYSFTAISGHSSVPLVLDDVIPLYAAGIPACWRLYYEGEQAEVERVMPSYLSHLTKLVQIPSKLQKSACGLLSQTHQLMALLSQTHENFGRAIEHCKQAVQYGHMAEDINLQAMALIRLQDTYFENRRFTQWFLTLKQAESLFIKQITPLLRGRIYARLSFAYAHQAQAELAKQYFDLAQNIFPSNPEADSSFLYNHTNHSILYANQALACIHVGQPQEAWKAITKAEGFVLGQANPRKIEITGQKIQATIAMNDLEASCNLFEIRIGFIQQFGQELDIGNTHDIYGQLVARWPHEKRVISLEKSFY